MIAGDLAIKTGDQRSNAKRSQIIYANPSAMGSKGGHLSDWPRASI
jgi:hypothetical protein